MSGVILGAWVKAVSWVSGILRKRWMGRGEGKVRRISWIGKSRRRRKMERRKIKELNVVSKVEGKGKRR